LKIRLVKQNRIGRKVRTYFVPFCFVLSYLFQFSLPHQFNDDCNGKMRTALCTMLSAILTGELESVLFTFALSCCAF